MKPIFFITTLLIVWFSTTSFATPKDKPGKKNEITEETRKQSAMFADGLRYFYADDYKNAETDFRKVIAGNAQNDAAYYLLGRIRVANKDYAGATFYLNEALKIKKNNEWYMVQLAEAYDLLSDYKASCKLWEAVCKKKPENEYYIYSSANSLLNLGDYQAVIKKYNNLEELMGYNEEITDAKVKLWLYLNNVTAAVGEYEKLIKEFPHHIEYYVKAGDILVINNKSEKAYTFYNQALQIDPNDGQLNLSLYNYYNNNKNRDKADECLLKAFQNAQLSITEKIPVLKTFFTNAVRSSKVADINECQALSEALTKAHPEEVEGWATLASLQLIKKDYAQSELTFEKALQISPSQFSLWEDYFYVLNQLKDYKTIISKYETVTDLFPTNASLLYMFGKSFLEENQFQRAIDILKSAVSLSFDTTLLSSCYEAMGDAYQAMGNKEKAIENWKLSQAKGNKTPELQNKINKQ